VDAVIERNAQPVVVERRRNGSTVITDDVVATEEPMEVRVVSHGDDGPRSESIAITMRTPGHDFELAAGFLLSEGLVACREDIVDVSYCPADGDEQQYNIVNVTLGAGAAFDASLLNRNFYATSSCGVCGKASLDALRTLGSTRSDDALRVSASLVRGLPGTLRQAQTLFDRTGGLHATGLFDAEGSLLTIREDVGRHNALDKVIGHHLMAGELPLFGRIAVVSGRASWELMQKALAAGIPMVVAVGAPSSLAVDLAQEFGMTLTGFTRADGFNVYAGAERVGA
jgi:FdhD protein